MQIDEYPHNIFLSSFGTARPTVKFGDLDDGMLEDSYIKSNPPCRSLICRLFRGRRQKTTRTLNRMILQPQRRGDAVDNNQTAWCLAKIFSLMGPLCWFLRKPRLYEWIWIRIGHRRWRVSRPQNRRSQAIHRCRHSKRGIIKNASNIYTNLCLLPRRLDGVDLLVSKSFIQVNGLFVAYEYSCHLLEVSIDQST